MPLPRAARPARQRLATPAQEPLFLQGKSFSLAPGEGRPGPTALAEVTGARRPRMSANDCKAREAQLQGDRASLTAREAHYVQWFAHCQCFDPNHCQIEI